MPTHPQPTVQQCRQRETPRRSRRNGRSSTTPQMHHPTRTSPHPRAHTPPRRHQSRHIPYPTRRLHQRHRCLPVVTSPSDQTITADQRHRPRPLLDKARPPITAGGVTPTCHGSTADYPDITLKSSRSEAITESRAHPSTSSDAERTTVSAGAVRPPISISAGSFRPPATRANSTSDRRHRTHRIQTGTQDAQHWHHHQFPDHPQPQAFTIARLRQPHSADPRHSPQGGSDIPREPFRSERLAAPAQRERSRPENSGTGTPARFRSLRGTHPPPELSGLCLGHLRIRVEQCRPPLLRSQRRRIEPALHHREPNPEVLGSRDGQPPRTRLLGALGRLVAGEHRTPDLHLAAGTTGRGGERVKPLAAEPSGRHVAPPRALRARAAPMR